MKKKDRPPHRPQCWQNTNEETDTFICIAFVPKEKECTYYYFASYNVNSEMAKIKVGEEYKQIDVVREKENTYASG